MKKITLSLVMLLCSIIASAQSPFFTPKIKREAMKFVASANGVGKSHENYQYYMKSILIRNLLIDDRSPNGDVDKVVDNYTYGIYECRSCLQPSKSQILLKTNDQYEFLNTSRPIWEALKDLELYFVKVPEAPNSLHWLYVWAVYRVYMENGHRLWVGHISVRDEYLKDLGYTNGERPITTD